MRSITLLRNGLIYNYSNYDKRNATYKNTAKGAEMAQGIFLHSNTSGSFRYKPAAKSNYSAVPQYAPYRRASKDVLMFRSVANK